jgi:membrane fusion protein, multidrug efflux system
VFCLCPSASPLTFENGILMNRSVLIAVVLTILAVVWVLSGGDGSETELQGQALAETNSDAPKLFKVKVRDISAQSMQDTIQLQGEIAPARSIVIKAETSGRIESRYADKGERVKQNATLIKIAINDRQARLEQAEATLKLRAAELEAGKQLKEKRMISGNQLEQAVANVAAAKAEVKKIKVEIQQTSIRAAFDGILNDVHVEQGDYVASGDPLAQLIDDQYLKIIAQVPQQHAAKLALGQSVEAELLDGTKIQGTLSYISNQANSATRTFEIEATAEPDARKLRSGQSARVRLSLGERSAHKVATSMLELASDGTIFVNGVDKHNVVVKVPVDIIRSESDGIWLSGIPDKFRLITVGQAFVSRGQNVEVIVEQNPEDDSPEDESSEVQNGAL